MSNMIQGSMEAVRWLKLITLGSMKDCMKSVRGRLILFLHYCGTIEIFKRKLISCSVNF